MKLEVMLYLAILAWNVYSIAVKNMVISLSHSSKDSITGTKDKSKKKPLTEKRTQKGKVLKSADKARWENISHFTPC